MKFIHRVFCLIIVLASCAVTHVPVASASPYPMPLESPLPTPSPSPSPSPLPDVAPPAVAQTQSIQPESTQKQTKAAYKKAYYETKRNIVLSLVPKEREESIAYVKSIINKQQQQQIQTTIPTLAASNNSDLYTKLIDQPIAIPLYNKDGTTKKKLGYTTVRRIASEAEDLHFVKESELQAGLPYQIYTTVLFNNEFGAKPFVGFSVSLGKTRKRNIVVTDEQGLVTVGTVPTDRYIPLATVDARYEEFQPSYGALDRFRLVAGISVESFTRNVSSDSAASQQATTGDTTEKKSANAYHIGLSYLLAPKIALNYGASFVPFDGNKKILAVGMYGISIDLTSLLNFK